MNRDNWIDPTNLKNMYDVKTGKKLRHPKWQNHFSSDKPIIEYVVPQPIEPIEEIRKSSPCVEIHPCLDIVRIELNVGYDPDYGWYYYAERKIGA